MKKNRGVSIFEIVIALSIITLLSIVTLPLMLDYQKTSKLRNQARELASDLRLTQQLSVTEQIVYQIILNEVSNGYQLKNSETNRVIKFVAMDNEVSINEISGFTDNTIKFNAAGGAIESGYVVLINSKNATSTIQIKPSGYVQIEDQ